MPSGNLTLLDIMKHNIGDAEVGLIDETKVATPEVTGLHPLTKQQLPMVADARTITGITYTTSVRTELPAVSLRNLNQGTAKTKSLRENRTVSCRASNPRWGVDKLAESIDSKLSELLAEEASAHVAAYLKLLGKLFFYGTNTTFGGDAKSFPGLLQSYDATNMDVDATGTTADTASSVWAVKFGVDCVRWVSGNNGQHEITDPRIGDFEDSDGNLFTGIIQELVARPGLQIGSPKYVGRIRNITAQAGKKLTGDMLGELVNTKFGLSYRPDCIFLTPRSLEQYRQDLQSVTASPSRILTPTEFEGIPLVPTESLVNTESINLVA